MTYRWKAVITYLTDNGPAPKIHYFEEIDDLHNIVESGPDWNAIVDIRVTYQLSGYPVTVEEATYI